MDMSNFSGPTAEPSRKASGAHLERINRDIHPTFIRASVLLLPYWIPQRASSLGSPDDSFLSVTVWSFGQLIPLFLLRPTQLPLVPTQPTTCWTWMNYQTPHGKCLFVRIQLQRGSEVEEVVWLLPPTKMTKTTLLLIIIPWNSSVRFYDDTVERNSLLIEG